MKIQPAFAYATTVAGSSQGIVVSYYIKYPDTIGEVESDALYIEGSDSFSPALTYEKNPGHDPLASWIPTFYLKSLDMDEKNYIIEAEPHIKLVEESSRRFWTDDFPPTRFWFNDIGIYIKSFFIFGASVLFITQLSNYDNVMYRAEIIPSIATSPHDVKDTRLEDFTEGQKYILYLHHNNNRLRIYVEGEQSPRWELMKADEEFIENFMKFPNRGRWPGDKDYKSYLAPDIFEPWPVLPLSELKNVIDETPITTISHRLTSNLRLRTKPGTSSAVVDTLPEGSGVYVLQTGDGATIDGISAPWVYVAAQNGKQGWCFSGYLEPVQELPQIPAESGEQAAENPASPPPTEVSRAFIIACGAACLIALGVIVFLRRKKPSS
jgi:hypothetical protein